MSQFFRLSPSTEIKNRTLAGTFQRDRSFAQNNRVSRGKLSRKIFVLSANRRGSDARQLISFEKTKGGIPAARPLLENSMGDPDSARNSVSRRQAVLALPAAGGSAFFLQQLGSGENEIPGTSKLWYDAGFAATMRDGMRDYERRIKPVKQELFRAAQLGSKDIVEIGLGTGPSIPLYVENEVRSVVGVEPNLAMHEVAMDEARRFGAGSMVSVIAGFAENLPMESNSADVVVCSMLLCSVRDVDVSAREIHRILKPGGKYVFLEHIAAPQGSTLHAMQVLFNPLQQFCACGCNLTRNPLKSIQAAGWADVDARYFSLGQTLEEACAPGSSSRGWEPDQGLPPPHFLLSPHVAGIATKA